MTNTKEQNQDNTKTKKLKEIFEAKENTERELVEEAIKEAKSLKEIVSIVKKKAFQTRVVTITYNDKRDSDKVTTAYLNCENQYFALSKIVPLNIPIKLEQCLIDCAKESKILQHIPEKKNGRDTGNMTPQLIRKYNVSYEE